VVQHRIKDSFALEYAKESNPLETKFSGGACCLLLQHASKPRLVTSLLAILGF
jgi:hypothetical protein